MANVRQIKCVLLGLPNTGKTALSHQYINHRFVETYRGTIGAEFGAVRLRVDEKNYNFQIWDTGSNGLDQATKYAYSRDAEIAVFVYNVEDKQSFEAIGKLVSDMSQVLPSQCKIALVGTHADSDKKVISLSEAQEKARQLKKCGLDENFCFEVSAKTGQGIGEMFEKLIRTQPEKRNVDVANYKFPKPSFKKRAIYFFDKHKWAIVSAILLTAAIAIPVVLFWPLIVGSGVVVAAAAAITALTLKIGFSVTATAVAASFFSIVGAALVTAVSVVIDECIKLATAKKEFKPAAPNSKADDQHVLDESDDEVAHLDAPNAKRQKKNESFSSATFLAKEMDADLTRRKSSFNENSFVLVNGQQPGEMIYEKPMIRSFGPMEQAALSISKHNLKTRF